MSSVSRSYSQRGSGSKFYSDDGIYGQTYQNMVNNFAEFSPVYRDSFILFKSMADLEAAIFKIEDNNYSYSGDHEVFTDLGKELRLGVLYGESSVITYRLLLRTQSSQNDAYYAIVDSSVNLDSPIAQGYGQVWAWRI